MSRIYKYTLIFFAVLLSSFLFASAQAETSYITVHMHNPENVEINSLFYTMSCNAFYRVYHDIYGFIASGCGVENNETHNQLIEVPSGTLHIRAIFNGMSQEKVVHLAPNEVKTVIFTFDRTEWDISAWLDSLGINGTQQSPTGSTFGCDYKSLNGFWLEACGDSNHHGSVSVSLTSNQFSVELSQPLGTRVCISGEEHVFAPNFFPDGSGFTSWYVQSFYRGDFPDIRFIDIDNKKWISIKSPIIWGTNEYVNYTVLIPSSIKPQTYSFFGYYECGRTFHGDNAKFKFSSVPYDLEGTGVKDEGNQPPVASFTFFPENEDHPSTIDTLTFDASSSYDPDGSIINYQWNFGDGHFANGMVVYHTFSLSGEYMVTLTVTDNDGFYDSLTKKVVIWGDLIIPGRVILSGNVVNSSRIDLSWTASIAGWGGIDHYEIYNATNDSLIDTTTGTTYSHTGLSIPTTYSYYVKAVDEANNKSAASNVLRTTVLPCITQPWFFDFEPNNSLSDPVIGFPRNIVPSYHVYGYIDNSTDEDWYQAYAYEGQTISLPIQVQATGTELGWSGRKPSGAVLFQQTGLGTSIPTSTAAYTVQAGEAGLYSLRIWNNNNNSTSTRYDFNVNVTPQTDTLSPSDITNLTATPISSTEVDLSWSASSDNRGPVGYGICNLDTNLMIDTTTSTSIRLTNLTPGVTYHLGVAAADGGGNFSGLATLSFTMGSIETNQCATIIFPTLHVPCFSFGSTSYWLNMGIVDYEPITLEISNFGDNGALGNASQCASFDFFSGTFHIPCFNLEGTTYWLDLSLISYDPIQLQLKNYGQ